MPVMDFELSDDQELLRTTVRRFLAARDPLGAVRARWGHEQGALPAIWDGLAALGVVGLLVPEVHGGAGMSMVDIGVVCEEMGRAVHPSPFVSSAVGAVSVVCEVGDTSDRATWLAPLGAGTVVGTVAILEAGSRYDWRSPTTTADDDGRLNGGKVTVADVFDATTIFVTASDSQGIGVYALDVSGHDPTPGVTIVATPSVDGSRPTARVELDGARGSRLGSGDATAGVGAVRDRLATSLVVDGLGAAARALELVVEHAKERVQFDRPIGSFQAVQHLCADMLTDLELTRAAAYYALWAADAGDPVEAHRAAVMARAQAAAAFPRLGASAIQVFGGIGFTWEHDIHLFYKRMLSASRAWGTEADALAELASAVL
jgi:alkylation response protein AidB-like acyl-CoA dehydrogenase